MITNKDIFFNKVTIVGVGLIGASFSLALKEKRLCKTVCGYGKTENNLEKATKLGIIDNYSMDVKKACEDSDLIFLATPVGIFRRITEGLKDTLKKDAIMTDAGSVKGRLVYELESLMPEGVCYIGSHPIAGSDKSGIEDARANLFNNARCIVTPTENSDECAKKKVISIWEAIGAKVCLISPNKHDEIYASVSHLPHVIAYAIVNAVGYVDDEHIDYAGQGFKDTTRIALSSPELWRDISILNKDNVVRMIGIFKKNLNKIEGLLQSGDASGIEVEFLKAQTLRKRLS